MICPSKTALQKFHRRQLPFDNVELIAAHIDACEKCRRFVQRLDDARVGASETAIDAMAAIDLPGTAEWTPSSDHDSLMPNDESGKLIPIPPAGYELLEWLGKGSFGTV